MFSRLGQLGEKKKKKKNASGMPINSLYFEVQYLFLKKQISNELRALCIFYFVVKKLQDKNS